MKKRRTLEQRLADHDAACTCRRDIVDDVGPASNVSVADHCCVTLRLINITKQTLGLQSFSDLNHLVEIRQSLAASNRRRKARMYGDQATAGSSERDGQLRSLLFWHCESDLCSDGYIDSLYEAGDDLLEQRPILFGK